MVGDEDGVRVGMDCEIADWTCRDLQEGRHLPINVKWGGKSQEEQGKRTAFEGIEWTADVDGYLAPIIFSIDAERGA